MCNTENFSTCIPNKLVKRIFDNIKYFCIFKDKGCNKNDLSFSQISEHEKYCLHNPERLIVCETCEEIYKYDQNHNCVDYLKEINKNLKEKILKLEKDNEIKEKEIQNKPINNLSDEFKYITNTLK